MNNCGLLQINNALIEKGPFESGPLHIGPFETSLTAHIGGTVNFSAQWPIASADVAAPTGDRSYPHRRQIYPRRERERRQLAVQCSLTLSGID